MSAGGGAQSHDEAQVKQGADRPPRLGLEPTFIRAHRAADDGDHSLKSDRAAIASAVQRWLDGLPL
jgi:hypothetical protein